MTQPDRLECARCGRPARDQAHLCDRCLGGLDVALAGCGFLAVELDTTMTRQRAAALSYGARSSTSTPLPWHDKASTAKRELHQVLRRWASTVDARRVRGRAPGVPADTIPALAAYLRSALHGLALLDDALDVHTEVTDAVDTGRRIVFWKRKTRIYLGPCGQTVLDPDDPGGRVLVDSCPGEVYADPDAQHAVCEMCSQQVTVATRQAQLERDLDALLFTAAELAKLAVTLGLEVPRERVRTRIHNWHRDGRIQRRGTAEDGSPRFQYGEVRQLLYAQFASDHHRQQG